jgi:GH15 family glucan-1,4-alpha-glucosidase
LNGFREWYDPATGKGYGAQEQLWSATLFLRAARALKKA